MIPSTVSSGLVNRPRLISKLKAAQERRVTIITAPAGYGKTTLAMQFARETSLPVAWQTVEERQRDISELTQASLYALSDISEKLQEIPLPETKVATELVVAIVDSLRKHVMGEAFYILDDVQWLHGFPAAEEWLSAIVRLLPSRFHLILLSRIAPDLNLHEMTLRRELLILNQNDLRFTSDETEALTVVTPDTTISLEHLLSLYQRLDGWPAGLILAVSQTNLPKIDIEETQSIENLFKLLARSMTNELPVELREFLFRSSVLTHFSPHLCSQVLEISDSSELIDEVTVRNLFISRTSKGLSYHVLFREFLQETFKMSQPALYRHINERAAHYCEMVTEFEEAIHHYLNAGLDDQAIRLMDQVAAEVFYRGRVETLLAWAMQISTRVDQPASLLYHCAIIHGDRNELNQSESDLIRAEVIFQARQDRIGMARIALQRTTNSLKSRLFADARARAFELLNNYPELPDLAGFALHDVGASYVFQGDATTAVGYLEKAILVQRKYANAHAKIQLLQTLFYTYARLGRLIDANDCLQEALTLQTPLGSNRALASTLNNLGYIYHLKGDYEQAITTFQDGLQKMAFFSDDPITAYLLWSLGDVNSDLFDFVNAEKRYLRALELASKGDPTLKPVVLISMARLKRRQGQWDEARTYAEGAISEAKVADTVLEGILAQAIRKAIPVEQEDEPLTVLEWMDNLLGELHRRQAQIELIQVLCLAADIALSIKHTQRATNYMKEAIEVSNRIGSAHKLAAEILHSAQLHEIFLTRFSLNDSLQTAIQRLSSARQPEYEQRKLSSASPMNERLPYNLRVYTLGHEYVIRDEYRLPIATWRSAAARLLFLSLFFRGAQTREELSAEFWPDSAPEVVRSNFHTTLYHARQAVGADTIVFEDGLYKLNPLVGVWCDAIEFNRLLIQSKLLSPKDVRSETRWRKVVEHYRGEFLTAFDANWITNMREHLKDLFIESLIGLGNCLYQRNDYGAALIEFNRASELDPFREDIHRLMLTCYGSQGDKAKVQAHFLEYQKFLRNELGIEPEPQTLQLVRQFVT